MLLDEPFSNLDFKLRRQVWEDTLGVLRAAGTPTLLVTHDPHEAMKMAEKLGLDPQTFYDISSQSSGYNWSLNAYTPMPGVGVPSPADNGYQGGFATALMLKDLRLAMEAAEGSDSAVPLSSRAAALYEDYNGAGNGQLDFSSIIGTY